MSGHSKWNNIKRKKEKTDAQKGKIFTKIGKEMAVAIRAGGPNPDNNSRLRDLIAVAIRNPGMRHGPWIIPSGGCRVFEIRSKNPL